MVFGLSTITRSRSALEREASYQRWGIELRRVLTGSYLCHCHSYAVLNSDLLYSHTHPRQELMMPMLVAEN